MKEKNDRNLALITIVFHMGLVKLDLDCIMPFFFNSTIKYTNNKQRKASTATFPVAHVLWEVHST
jgi:hypothetical protein